MERFRNPGLLGAGGDLGVEAVRVAGHCVEAQDHAASLAGGPVGIDGWAEFEGRTAPADVDLKATAAEVRPVVLRAGDLVFDVAASSVRRGATEIGLSRREMDVLEVLMRSDGAPVAKREIFNRVWGFDAEVDSNVVEVYIRYLRRKIDEPLRPNSAQAWNTSMARGPHSNRVLQDRPLIGGSRVRRRPVARGRSPAYTCTSQRS